MKVAYLSSARLPSRAANGIQVMRMCESFAALGNRLTLVSVRTGSSDQAFEFYGVERNFRIQEVSQPSMRGGVYWYALKAGMLARSLNVDLVYARCLPSCYVASFLGLPFALEIHTDIRDYGKKCEYLFHRMKKARNLRRIVVITHALKRRLCDAYGVEENRILVAPDAATPVPGTAPAEDYKHGLDIGYTGHLYPGKGLELILDLASRLPWARFHVVGGEPEDVAAWRSRCGDLSNVTFHGFVDPARIDDLRARFDILVAPYQRTVATQGGGKDIARWMSPLKIFEYMSAARPIVASRLPAIEEVLEDKRNAILCDPEDTDEWVRALEGLFRDSNLRRELAVRAQEDFEENYTWERRAVRILEAV